MTIKQQVKDGVAELRDYILLLEDQVKMTEKERDYLDGKCAEYEHYKKLNDEWVNEKIKGLNTFEEIERMVKLAERLNKESAKEIIHCGWCKAEFDTKVEVQKHLIKCDKNPLVKRLAEFENMARDFVEYRAPDHVCRMHFEMMLKNVMNRRRNERKKTAK